MSKVVDDFIAKISTKDYQGFKLLLNTPSNPGASITDMGKELEIKLATGSGSKATATLAKLGVSRAAMSVDMGTSVLTVDSANLQAALSAPKKALY